MMGSSIGLIKTGVQIWVPYTFGYLGGFVAHLFQAHVYFYKGSHTSDVTL
jgi:hypothetical protein